MLALKFLFWTVVFSGLAALPVAARYRLAVWHERRRPNRSDRTDD